MTMPATKTTTEKLTTKRVVLSKLIKQSLTLGASIADQNKIKKSVDLKTQEILVDEKINKVEIPNAGTAELITKPGNVTWDDAKLIKIIKQYAKDHKADPIDVLHELCKIKEPRKSDAEKLGIDVEDAKKIADSKITLKVSE